jgi:acyl-CoA-binding protein
MNSKLDLEYKFNKCTLEYTKLQLDLDLNDKLHMYGLFKQATIGDVNTQIPSLFQVMERKKWEAWDYFKGKQKSSAMNDYVEYYLNILSKYKIRKL